MKIIKKQLTIKFLSKYNHKSMFLLVGLTNKLVYIYKILYNLLTQINTFYLTVVNLLLCIESANSTNS